ncbi:phosphoenolpyruvate-protein phosphotransferase of PTS system [Lachnospiraceae bacterium KM106-2]|nr:phosphoenolpyruvate-protein phosphotransferase of PTS system [Lachnospiraceae bacterium KM106-2]
MKVFKGTAVFGGIAFGTIFIYEKKEQQIKRKRVDDIEGEIKRFETGKAETIHQLQQLYEKALKEVGEANAQIFEVHQMMLDDLDYIESVQNIIRTQSINAEYAVGQTAENFANMFASMDDAYMKERAADVRDVSERLLGVLGGNNGSKDSMPDNTIILADDLAPSETVQLDKNRVKSFITVHGSTNSHTAILARTMNIPALINIDMELSYEYNGKEAIVDGYSGSIYLEPDEATKTELRKKYEADQEKKQLLHQLKGQESITKDGQKIHLYCNIGSPSDVGKVLANDGEGVGLFRSEFLYLETSDFPTEEQQFTAYKTVAENMHGKKVIIRTLDIGADKQIDYFNLEKEENPAMGYRAIRICLDQTDIFRTQLRAIYRASMYGNVSIMFPMIISVEEVKKIKEIVRDVQNELEEQSIPYKQCELGIMIETPAAAVISDLLAKEVDFFSIGTNDLTQYTLAVDRQNPKLDHIYDPHHEAILRLLRMIADNAHKEGIWCGICGELGADLTLTEEFLKMGMDELSVSAPMLLPLRKKVRETDVSALRS